MEAVVEGPRRRRWRWKRLLWLPVLLAAFSCLQVLVLRFIDPPVSMVMLWRYGEALGEADWSYRLHYQWRDLDQMAPSLPISLVAAEDQRFPDHNGFDLQAIEKARDHNAKGGRLRGASTISQQVAKNLFLWQGRSWIRKGLEVWYTVLIEALWPKERILEMYANIAEFGDGVYGAQAAAQKFWGKDAARLSPADSARLAAVLPAPRRYNAAKPGPYVQRRAAWISARHGSWAGPRTFRKSERAPPDLRPAATYNPGMTRERLTFVIAAYNEALALPLLHPRLCAVLDALPDIDGHILYVDDGSHDGTWEVIARLAQSDARVSALKLSRNFGKEAALTAGLDLVREGAAMILDADGQDPPELVPQFVARWREGHDNVYGTRLARDGEA